jgi:hypothetical protein
MHFRSGIGHLKMSLYDYEWISDFLFTAAWLMMVTIAGVRLLKAARSPAA